MYFIAIIAIIVGSSVFGISQAKKLGGFGKLFASIKSALFPGDIDPKRNNVKSIALTVETVAIWASVVTSAVSIGTVAYTMTVNNTGSKPFAGIVAFVLIVAVSYISDYGFRQFSTKFIYELFVFPMGFWTSAYKKGAFPNAWAATMHLVYSFTAWAMVGAIAVLMFGMSWMTSYMGANDAYTWKENKERPIDLDDLSRRQDEALAKDVALVDKDIQLLNDRTRLVEERKKKSLGSLVALVNEGNKWAPKELESQVSKSSASTISKRDELLDKKQALIDAAIANKAALMQEAIARNQALMTKAQTSEGNFISLFRWFGLGASGLQVLCRVFLVLLYLSGGVKDTNGDGKISSEDVDYDPDTDPDTTTKKVVTVNDDGTTITHTTKTQPPVGAVAQNIQPVDDTEGIQEDYKPKEEPQTQEEAHDLLKAVAGKTIIKHMSTHTETRIHFNHKARYDLLAQRWRRSYISATPKAKFDNRVKALADVSDFAQNGYACWLDPNDESRILIAGVNECQGKPVRVGEPFASQMANDKWAKYVAAEIASRRPQSSETLKIIAS